MLQHGTLEMSSFNRQADPINLMHDMPNGYTLSAYILIVEERTCETCGATHEVPALNLRVELVNTRTAATRTVALADMRAYFSSIPGRIRREFENPVLPRRIQYVATSVSFCQHCFSEATGDQVDMFKPDWQPLRPSEIAFTAEYAFNAFITQGSTPTRAELELAYHKRQQKQRASGDTGVTGSGKKAKVAPMDLSQFLNLKKGRG